MFRQVQSLVPWTALLVTVAILLGMSLGLLGHHAKRRSAVTIRAMATQAGAAEEPQVPMLIGP